MKFPPAAWSLLQNLHPRASTSSASGDAPRLSPDKQWGGGLAGLRGPALEKSEAQGLLGGVSQSSVCLWLRS